MYTCVIYEGRSSVRDFSELSSVNSETEQYNYRSKAAGIDHNGITVTCL